MATAVQRLEGDTWLQIPATWGAYLRLDRARGEKSNPKYIYCNGRLTIVTTGAPHEAMKQRISWFLESMFVVLGVPFLATGAFTLKQGGPKKKGVEGDTSYYLTNLDRLRGDRDLVMGVDPPPDLEVEVVISHPVRDALKAHASFGVREVWVIKASAITFLVLGPDGRYHPAPTSAGLPFLSSEEMTAWLFRCDFPDEVALRRAYLGWLTATLAPRLGRGVGPDPGEGG